MEKVRQATLSFVIPERSLFQSSHSITTRSFPFRCLAVAAKQLPQQHCRVIRC